MPEYRIEYTIQQADEPGGEFYEIGFGSSTTWDDLDSAVHAVASAVQNGQWETEPGMPEPDTVLAEIRSARDSRDG